MTKKELADVIHTKIGLSKRESAEIVEFFFNVAKDRLSSGEGIKLPRFGSFRVKLIEQAAREYLCFGIDKCYNPFADCV